MNTMVWKKAADVKVERGKRYLIRTNGGEWGDNDTMLLHAPMLEHLMKPNVVRGKPLWVAEVTEPTENPLPVALVDRDFAEVEARIHAEIQGLVDRALNASVENGFEDLAKNETIEILAADMATEDADIERIMSILLVDDTKTVEFLKPYIRVWREAHV